MTVNFLIIKKLTVILSFEIFLNLVLTNLYADILSFIRANYFSHFMPICPLAHRNRSKFF